MVDVILQWLKEIGLIGLFAAMFLEGSSLPFPGIAVVLAYGYILPFNYWNTAFVATAMSLTYCLASLIPYFLGSKIDGLFKNGPKKGLQKAKDLFVRYGSWSVAISRPFGLGNYISYVAGMSKMRLIPYFLLTFVGIYPWSFAMILLGNYFNGSYEAFKTFYQSNSIYLYVTVAIVIVIIGLNMVIQKKGKAGRIFVRKGGNESCVRQE